MDLTQLKCSSCGSPIKQSITPQQPFRCSACGSLLIMASSGKPPYTTCPECQTTNHSLNRYCSLCGTKLLVDCPICYQSNVVGSNYCEHCSVNIEEEIQRRKIWRELKRKFDRRRKDALVKALKDEQRVELQRLLAELDEPDRHAFAIFYLCQQGEAAFEPLIETLRADPDPDARYGAARTLGMMGNTQAIPELIRALSDQEPAVRYWAIDALVSLDARYANESISKLTDDHYKWVRKRAEKALKQLG